MLLRDEHRGNQRRTSHAEIMYAHGTHCVHLNYMHNLDKSGRPPDYYGQIMLDLAPT